MENEKEIIDLVTRGFQGIEVQLKDRDTRVSILSDKMIGVEMKLDMLKETLIKVETEMSRSEHESIKIKVLNLETLLKEYKDKQDANALWLRGLMVSVILLLVGFLFNFLTIKLR